MIELNGYVFQIGDIFWTSQKIHGRRWIPMRLVMKCGSTVVFQELRRPNNKPFFRECDFNVAYFACLIHTGKKGYSSDEIKEEINSHTTNQGSDHFA